MTFPSTHSREERHDIRADRRENPSPRVVVVAPATEAPEIESALGQIGFRASSSARTGGAQEGLSPVAAIVCDRGAEFMCRISALSRRYPVILISDEMSFDYRLEAARAGVSAIVRRPLRKPELAEWLSAFSTRAASEPFTVVIVDDDRLSSAVNAAVLRSTGMEVVVVQDPRSALAVVEDAVPDLVLMDIRMPEVDGIEMAKVIRQRAQFASLPILFFSAELDEARQLEARSLGGDDFITKPVSPARLIALVTMRAERSRRLRALIERDRLTGLLNQARFRERLAQEVDRCARTGSPMSLVAVDVDHFKSVNDRYGHSVGDDVLRRLADLFATSLRRTDVVGRCGGEEFGALLLDCDAEEARRTVDHLRKKFRAVEFQGEGEPFRVSFSAGVASCRGWHSPVHLAQAADAALYAAKQAGRDVVHVAAMEVHCLRRV